MKKYDKWIELLGAIGLYVRDLVGLIGPRLMCLGRTVDGHPRHPLYVCADKKLEPL